MFWNKDKDKISFERKWDRVMINFQSSQGKFSHYDCYYINWQEVKFSYPPQRAVEWCIRDLQGWLEKIKNDTTEGRKDAGVKCQICSRESSSPICSVGCQMMLNTLKEKAGTWGVERESILQEVYDKLKANRDYSDTIGCSNWVLQWLNNSLYIVEQLKSKGKATTDTQK